MSLAGCSHYGFRHFKLGEWQLWDFYWRVVCPSKVYVFLWITIYKNAKEINTSLRGLLKILKQHLLLQTCANCRVFFMKFNASNILLCKHFPFKHKSVLRTCKQLLVVLGFVFIYFFIFIFLLFQNNSIVKENKMKNTLLTTFNFHRTQLSV